MKQTDADGRTIEERRRPVEFSRKSLGLLLSSNPKLRAVHARVRSTLLALSRGLDFPQPVVLVVLVNHAFLAALANLEKRARKLAGCGFLLREARS